jgi:epoxide hydrolase
MTEFVVDIPESALEELRDRIRRTRWPERETVGDRSQGVPLDELRTLCQYWADGYDWRRCERALNAVPQVRVEIDGVAIHALHVRSPHPEATPLVLTHGWPGSVLEFLEVIGPLTDPVAHGADVADAFHVVVPSLPGYGFSDKPAETGWNADRIAAAWAELMSTLGYGRFAAQGGDWGAIVTTALARHCPERLIGIHVNMPLGARPDDEAELSERDRRAIESMAEFRRSGSGYSAEQSTRPQTIGYALVDSPVALCAWIVEKLVEWTDGGDAAALSRDAMLDNVTLYWLTATGASAARLYWETRIGSSRGPVDVPAGCSLFPGEVVQTARPFAEQVYRDLRYWHEVDAGGHFAAWEQPELFVDEVRSFFRLVRD